MKEGHPTLQKPQKAALRPTRRRGRQSAHDEDNTEPERDVYGGGAGPTGMTNILYVGGGDGGARLTVAEGVVLREACVGETTSECRDDDGGARELPPEMWEERDGV